MRYSTFTNVIDVQSTLVEESWDAFVARLSKFIVTSDKRSVPLFCGATFIGSGRRAKSTSEECSIIILDFDNTRHENGAKLRIDDPVSIETVKAMLMGAGLEFVLTTTHSHSEDWPHFRVVVPIEVPVKASKWLDFTEGLLRQLHLDELKRGLDPCYKTVSQIYYWPSHGPDRPHLFVHERGKQFVPVLTLLPRQRRESETGRFGGLQSDFTEEQIHTYYAHVAPTLDWYGNGTKEWKNACPLHGGTKPNFYVNKSNGLWKCHSTRCNDANEDGTDSGNVYSFHARLFNVTYNEARKAVHEIIGGEPGAKMTTEELASWIAMAAGDAVPYIIDEIAKQPTGARKDLQSQLSVKFPDVGSASIKADVAAKRKVVSLRPEQDDGPREHQQNAYGLRLDCERYVMDGSGVYLMKPTKEGYFVKQTPPVTDRPIWIETMGQDFASDRTYVKLCWEGSHQDDAVRKRHEQWLPAEAVNSKETLIGLDDGPVSLDNVLGVMGFLRYTKTVLSADFLPVTSKIGWVEREGEPVRFVGPGDDQYAYIGPPIVIKGTIDGWARGLQTLLLAGTQGFKGLTCVGLSAASPFVRLIGKRRPSVGLIAESSSGKGKVIALALAIWSRPELIPIGSTFKGVQDRNVHSPDYPIALDEVQQIKKLDPTALENLFYFMGNAQRRFTSSRGQTAKGGDQLYGVCMFASEEDVIPAMEGGAQNRVIGLYGDPLPNEIAATVLHKAAAGSWGVVGAALVALLNERKDEEVKIIEAYAEVIARSTRLLKGDDHFTVALIRRGLELLSEVTGIVLPVEAHERWLIDLLSGARVQTKDSVENSFCSILDTIISSEWGNGGSKNTLFDAGQVIAWRLTDAVDATKGPLELNFSSRRMAELLKLRSQSDKVVREWIQRGWIQAQSKNTCWIRPANKDTGAGTKVWRVTPAGLKLVGYGPDFGAIVEAVVGE